MIRSVLMLEMKDQFQLGVEKRLQKRGKNSAHDGTAARCSTTLYTLPPEQSN